MRWSKLGRGNKGDWAAPLGALAAMAMAGGVGGCGADAPPPATGGRAHAVVVTSVEPGVPAPVCAPADATEAAIIGAAIDGALRNEGSPLVLSQRTVAPTGVPQTLAPTTTIEPIDDGMLADLAGRSGAPACVADVATLGAAAPVVLVDGDGLRQGFLARDADAAWQLFHARYGDVASWIEVGRPGFDETGQRAALYVTSARGPLWGSGQLVGLDQVEGVWSVTSRLPLWTR